MIGWSVVFDPNERACDEQSIPVRGGISLTTQYLAVLIGRGSRGRLESGRSFLADGACVPGACVPECLRAARLLAADEERVNYFRAGCCLAALA